MGPPPDFRPSWTSVKPSKSLHLSRFLAQKLIFRICSFWHSDFEEGGAAELGGGVLGLGIDRRRCG